MRLGIWCQGHLWLKSGAATQFIMYIYILYICIYICIYIYGGKSVGEKSLGENRGKWDAGFRSPSQVFPQFFVRPSTSNSAASIRSALCKAAARPNLAVA